MPLIHRLKRDYRIRTPEMVTWIVSCLKMTPYETKMKNLNDYEKGAISQPRGFAKFAPLEEIIVIMNKLGWNMGIMGYDSTMRMYGTELRNIREGYSTGKKGVKDLINFLGTKKYFVLVGKEIMRTQTLFSQLIHGSIYVINQDFKTFMKMGSLKLSDAEQYKNMKAVDEVIANVLTMNPVEELDDKDLAIIFLLRKYDDVPLSLKNIRELLSFGEPVEFLYRHLAKLWKYGYVERNGRGHNQSYMLSSKGWLAKEQARKQYFHGVRFYEHGQSMIIEEIKQKRNGANATKEETEFSTMQ